LTIVVRVGAHARGVQELERRYEAENSRLRHTIFELTDQKEKVCLFFVGVV
jgi:ribosomal protein S6